MSTHPRITLVTGGCRSGKSRYAQELAESLGPKRVMLATAEARDDEMRDRIARHQADRRDGWRTIESPIDIVEHLDHPGEVLLVDCLTLWVSNLLCTDATDAQMEAAAIALVDRLQDVSGPVILVTNEVGLGIVPMNKLARRFRDQSGFLAQRIARVADRVVLCVTGIPMVIKDRPIQA
jgi:adenosylcobinamide kinase/adenosylcobinamide-phosphate guanylyltransferase